MVDLAGDDSPYKQSVDNSVLLVAAAIVMAVFGKLKKTQGVIYWFSKSNIIVITPWLVSEWISYFAIAILVG